MGIISAADPDPSASKFLILKRIRILVYHEKDKVVNILETFFGSEFLNE